ncbi:hypothetical protein NE237_027811 [Protea cynaroides]|uniref:25S rRNA (uridine-N(3))-methyltransferase BMT5-like domain-containing protein n=1 Tax=Protea cynaroides TaxID=273540 RepID=A0A9Q0GSL0_9MAGN|nr:hypothetical protein NE237_027811 [Protea cynaroides]
MVHVLAKLRTILSEMGQVLSNLVSILFGRKKTAKKPDEENGEPLLSASGDPQTKVSEDERVSINIDSDQIVEESKPTLHVSTRDKTRVSEDERVSINIGSDQIAEEIKPTLHVSTRDKTRVSEDERVSINIDSNQIVEEGKPTLHVSTRDKTRVSEDERVSINIGSDQIAEEIKPTLHVSTRDKTRVSEDERVSINIASDQIVEKIKPTLRVSTGDKTRVSEDERVSTIIESYASIVKKIKPTLKVSTGDNITVSKDDLGAKAPNGTVLKEERRIKHYYSSHKILLVGEGDFSFSACLANAFGSAGNMVSTSLDSKGFLKKNYSNAMSNINDLKSRGCVVLHGVDATTMSGHVFFKGMRFDRIVFNFPHAGFFDKESRESQIRRHQNLLTLFFKNAKKMLSEDGEIHISHKTSRSHKEWNIESLASLNGLYLYKAKKFKLNHYPGYNTKYGFGGDGNFDCYPSQTYMFGL